MSSPTSHSPVDTDPSGSEPLAARRSGWHLAPLEIGDEMAAFEPLASSLSVAAVVFVSTNVDDIVLLSLLCADPALKPRSVIIGQFLGIAALVAISGALGAASVAVPQGYVALLGVIPLVLGLKKLWELKSPDDSGDDRRRSAPDRATACVRES